MTGIHSLRDFDFKEKKRYVVNVSTQFYGKFVGYETENGITYAIFEEEGKTDHGNIPKRKVNINNITSYGPNKV